MTAPDLAGDTMTVSTTRRLFLTSAAAALLGCSIAVSAEEEYSFRPLDTARSPQAAQASQPPAQAPQPSMTPGGLAQAPYTPPMGPGAPMGGPTPMGPGGPVGGPMPMGPGRPVGGPKPMGPGGPVRGPRPIDT